MPKIGDNTKDVKKDLEKFLKKVETLVEQRKGIQEDIREVKTDAKNGGIDMPAFNVMLKLRAMDIEKRREQEEMRDLYMAALDLC